MMANAVPIAATAAAASASRPALAQLSVYLELTKPRITILVLVTTLVGFALASPGTPNMMRLMHTLFGTALVAAGASALNQVLEREADGRMNRTRSRPLPSGRLKPDAALVLAVDTATLGVAWLAVAVNRPAALLAAATLASYVLAYTPLKRRTPWSTVVGAVPGALPPVIGWVAASGELTAGAAVLFAILFIWQLPHFFAIGWLYREDYVRAGFRLLPVIDPDGRLTARQITTTTALLIPATLAPVAIGMNGSLYLAGAILLAFTFLRQALAFGRSRADADARRLFRTSLLILPALLGLMLLDRATG